MNLVGSFLNTMLRINSVKMYQNRLTKWGFEKNNKESEIKAIVRKKSERSAINKASNFEIRGRPVNLADVDRYVRRKRWAIEDIIAGASPAPTPPDLTCITPRSIPGSPATPPILSIPECIVVSIRDYFIGSFDAGTWTFNDDASDCVSKKPKGSDMLALKNLFSHHDLACKLLDKGSFDEAGRELGNASVGIQEILSAEHPRTLGSLFDLIMLLRGRRRPEIARIVVSQFATLAAVVHPTTHPLHQVCKLLMSLDPAQFELVAITAWQSAVDQFEGILGPMHYSTLRSRLEYIQMAESVYGYERAEKMLRDLVLQCEGICSPDDVRRLKLLETLAEMLLDQNKYDEAEVVAQDIVRHAPSSEPHAKSIDLLCASLFVIARVQHHRFQLDMAEANLRRVISLNVSQWGRQHALTLKYLLHLEEWLAGSYQHAKAEAVKLERLRIIDSIDRRVEEL
jgi:hypothetical protein